MVSTNVNILMNVRFMRCTWVPISANSSVCKYIFDTLLFRLTVVFMERIKNVNRGTTGLVN